MIKVIATKECQCTESIEQGRLHFEIGEVFGVVDENRVSALEQVGLAELYIEPEIDETKMLEPIFENKMESSFFENKEEIPETKTEEIEEIKTEETEETKIEEIEEIPETKIEEPKEVIKEKAPDKAKVETKKRKRKNKNRK